MSAALSFDLVVIGAGPGGYVAAIRAAQLGLRTALVESRKELGGTCLNIGCIPSKALLASSEHFHFATHDAARHGIRIGEVGLDLPAMMRRKETVVNSLRAGVDTLVKRNGIERFHGTGRIPRPGIVEVHNSTGATTLEARHILLATGSVPSALPGIEPDGTDIVTSTEALAFDGVPPRLAVIGAGAIGLELGSVWARLGSQVTVLEFLPRIAPGFDAEIAGQLGRALEQQGISFRLGARVRAVEPADPAGLRIQFTVGDREESLEADKVLMAVGRKPFLGDAVDPGLGLVMDERGRVAVDAQFRTSVPGILAIGDLIPGPMLAHKAEEEGVACAEILAGRAGHVNRDTIPGVIYTFPEAASVGIDEAEAAVRGLPVRTGKFPLRANARALASGWSTGLAKVIAHAETDRLLGVHLLAPGASELIAEAVSVMEFGGSAEDLGRTVHAHPTVSEMLKEAALAAGDGAIHTLK
jgi:dihydrolipoamide dehydrogenase